MSESYNPEAGYRPYHAEECPARDAARSPEPAPTGTCTCGGLADPVWRPGDEPCGTGAAQA
jgi:hypothetical protein